MKMKLVEAERIAVALRAKLYPFCERIEIAGSIRRRRPVVGDIELVCIPKTISMGLFGDQQERHPWFCRIVNGWPAVKGKPEGKYTQRDLPEGIKLDLFMAVPANWGLIYAIRTGSAAYSHQVLARGWVRHGYKSEGGFLRMNGGLIPVPEERRLFDLIGIPWKRPEDRK